MHWPIRNIQNAGILAALLAAAAIWQPAAAIVLYPSVTGKALIDSLRAHYKTGSTLGYDNARDKMYGEIDITADSLTCVYSGLTIHGGPTGDPRSWATANDIDCEHTWPQSYLSSAMAESDIHHLYPTWNTTNSSRGNLPFGEIADAEATDWYRNGVVTHSIPGSDIDAYSERLVNVCFEPREVQAGNTARSMFYVLTMYQLADTDLAWWTGQKNDLRSWHHQDPATSAESLRTYRIAAYQQNKPNPFVIDSTLVDRCYFPQYLNTQIQFSPTTLTRSEVAGTCSLTVSITSPSGSNATTAQVVLAGGTGTAADINNYSTQTVTFPAGSSASQIVILTITNDILVESNETLVFRLRSVSGGTSAAAGPDSGCTLTINDNDTPANTVISFSPAGAVKAEGDPPFNITVAIASPSGSIATTAQVVLAGGSGTAADINNYSTQTVTFPAGSSTSQNVQITITDDALAEGAETLVFKLRSVSGGTGAAPGPDSAFTLTLNDNDGGAGFTVVINEVNEQRSSLPGYKNEYVELYNATAGAINLNGWQLRQDGSAYVTTFGTGDIIPAGGYFVIIRDATGNWSSYYGVLYNKVGSLVMNGSEGFCLRDNSGTTVDSTVNFGSSYWCQLRTRPLSSGSLAGSWVLDPDTASNTTYGTPGGSNPLATELSSFTCQAEDSRIIVSWATESEDGVMQWVVEKSETPEGNFAPATTVSGAGNSQISRHYRWADDQVVQNKTYYYKLVEVGLSGGRIEHGVLQASLASPLSRTEGIIDNRPNPFSSGTVLGYAVGSSGARVSLRIYSAAGQLVRELLEADQAPGEHRACWDGRDADGRAAANGIYICRLVIGGSAYHHRMTILR